ncbi:isoleucine--tRNA ligase [Pontibacter sp. G13]|uniref:isoleucine--tRNA ligase n=1 Tax=Pontibacter sp. G13 TaxID=3074898 RepID=UPI002889F521|nr:isoleucine--tRNA ligase [Pontibacter sp. G13]WNJ21432.1 isoleucine--tRNA ligase [Pontibacter sp. G13]
MSNTYPEYKQLSLPEVDKQVLKFWEDGQTFEKSVSEREGNPTFTFYEGPPSANGKPGIHHVIARTIKDLVCRYKTLQGFQVKRKGGWDTHGLPVELQVEKRLGIKKEDIGTKITIEEYNAACRKDVLMFKDLWDDLTRKMGYWVDLDNPYITFDNNYIESVWNLLQRLWDKDLLYKGFTIQPYSPAAGTGLSSHELNMPGTYREIKDTTVVAQFQIKDKPGEYFIAWTTTPWTLPSNTALAVGKQITYCKVKTFNPYTYEPITVYLAKDLMGKYFNLEDADRKLENYEPGDKHIPFEVLEEVKGADLVGMEYEQLMPYVTPEKPAFRVIHGDFVSTEDGTGIVHIAPTFGGDDFIVANQNDIPPLMVTDADGNKVPLVNKQGKFVAEVTDFADRYVKDYGQEEERSVDVDIAIKLKTENKAFKVEKYLHTYPHCWRTDRPVLYYPLDSWFVRTTSVKDKLIEHNNTINWKPASTGTGRFGNWLENLVDWNLSRSRFWGIPLPVWSSEDGKERVCIGSVEELKQAMSKSVAAGYMSQSEVDDLVENLDLHKPYVDRIKLVSESGQLMTRESDLIDVWFDSGSMPFAQWHYPFENQETFRESFPADFISEGVDQTRGWFFTLHAIAVMLEDSVAFKNVISTGLLQDKDGRKMSKRYGNVIDPFDTIAKYGADATRWYIIGNSMPWENLKFDINGVKEVQRKFFGTLHNTYNFFALYANLAGFKADSSVPVSERQELDQWITSVRSSLIKEVEQYMDDYEPTRAVRAIDQFVNELLSNWYVRLARRRFWDGDKAAFQTLFECLETVAILMSPFAPFYADRLYRDLMQGSGAESVHLARFPKVDDSLIDLNAEARMEMAQKITSLILSIRRKEKLKVRQPLEKAMVALLDPKKREALDRVKDLVAHEVNLKKIEYITEDNSILVKKVKPNFRTLGPKVGPMMKEIGPALAKFDQADIRNLETQGVVTLQLSDREFQLELSDVEIKSEDIPGWSVASDGDYTVALDVTLTDELRQEGIAREFVNRIQNLRKGKGFDVTDKIEVQISHDDAWVAAISNFKDYISAETLAEKLEVVNGGGLSAGDEFDIDGVKGMIQLTRI